ncbi:MAG: DUF1614 domain-containing protein [Candidatus Wildermuthbacteria bacterium]|nr:DUF1614 domain-containing protein [Candidatus Wildermuthbacteria bacterium]
MFFSFPGLFTFLLLIILVPALFIFGVFEVLSRGLENIGISERMIVGVVFLMAIGSFISIPLGKKKIIAAEERRAASGLAINIGGGVIPLVIVAYLLPRLPLQASLVAIVLMIVLSYTLSRSVPKKGVRVSLVLPPIFAALFAMILAPQAAPSVAFAAGVLGVLIGGDILRMPWLLKQERGMVVIGGGGVFDGIFLVGVVSSLLAGFTK